ncbi:MAG: FAD-binding and (Fe-S)-binding domain-containing protein [Promethearchaeota archaeon]|jgi:glycolate oxidase
MSQTYNKLTENLLLDFKKIVGENCFFIAEEHRWSYTFGSTMIEPDWVPELILIPQNSYQISEILKIADKNKIPITPRGSGTSLSGGSLTPYGGILLDLSTMNQIITIDIENNLVEVEPGVICDELNEKLKSYEYFFPPDPGSSSIATIGGMVATNAGGIQAFKYGVTKNYVQFLEVVFANGKIMNLGSNVLKSVSSYNLKDLIVGSEGTLGIVTKIGLKIRPLPKNRKLGLFLFDNIDRLTEAVLEIRRKGIVTNLFEFMDKVTVCAIFDYLGDEFQQYPKEYALLAEIDGINEESVEAEFSILFDILIKQHPTFYKIANSTEERSTLIAARKAAFPAYSRIAPSCCIEDCTIKITDFAEVIKKFEDLPKKLDIPNIVTAMVCHMEGNLHPTFIFNENDPKDRADFEKAAEYFYKEIIIPIGGSVTGEHGIGKVKTKFMELEHGSDVTELMHQIKKLLDPNMILNPGIGKGDIRPIRLSGLQRTLKNQPNKLLGLNCMRCGFCQLTCPSRTYYKSEAYSPRGRLSLLNALVHNNISLESTTLINDIMNSCMLCGRCSSKCPAGVKTHEIFEKARELLHEKGDGYSKS